MLNKQLFEGEKIIEEGSNANGSWTKWDTGKMECWGTFEVTDDISSTYGSMYRRFISSVSFSQTFDAAPDYLTVDLVDSTNIGECWVSTRTRTTTDFAAVLWSPQSQTSRTYTLSYFARGEWS